MCLLTLRSTDNKDGTIQQDDPPTSCKDGRQDFNIQQFSSIEEHEREVSTSYIKTPCSIRMKLEAAINLDRSLNADAVEDEDLGELRATLESADDNLITQVLQNETNNLKEDHPKFEMEKDKMCLKTSNTQGEIQQEKQLTSCEDCSTDIHVRYFSVNYQNEGCTDQHNTLQHPAAISKHTFYRNCFSKTSRDQVNSLRPSSPSIHENITRFLRKMILIDDLDIIDHMIEVDLDIIDHIIEEKSQRELMKMMLEGKLEITDHMIEAAGGNVSKKLKAAKEEIKIPGIMEECAYRYSFFPDTFRIWNGLPQHSVSCTTLEPYKKGGKRKLLRIILEEMKKKERKMKEHIRMLFAMLLLVMLIKSISENFQCRQTSCRKYPSLNSILYLLWQSGDVEVNPGPAKSTIYRKWLYDICSIVRKEIAGIPAECNMFNIWKKKPDNWPRGELYSDPRNTKGMTVNKVENFLLILINCCDTNNLSREIKSEIDTWNSDRSKDNGQLLHLCRMRECLKSVEQVNKSLKVLQGNFLAGEVLRVEADTCIIISFYCQTTSYQQLITHTIYKSEATRKIASFLWKILHGKDPEKKYDFIWTQKPDWWPLNVSFYDPNNGGKLCAENEREDAMLVNTIYTKCKDNEIKLQKPYKDIVEAWLVNDQTLLSKLMARHTAETDIKKAVMKLHEEGLLQEVDTHFKELGLKVQYDESTQNPKSQSDNEDAVEATLMELSPDCSIGQLLDNQSDSFLEEKIVQNIPDLLGDEADDIHVLWNQ